MAPNLAVALALGVAGALGMPQTLPSQTISSAATATAMPAYCTTAPPPSLNLPSYLGPFAVHPPLPCHPAKYDLRRGICCAERRSCPIEGDGPCSCGAAHGRGSSVVWSMPLEPCVAANPLWSGCPGNMIGGLCCAGAGVAAEGKEEEVEDSGPACLDGEKIFTVDEAGSTSHFRPAVGDAQAVVGRRTVSACSDGGMWGWAASSNSRASLFSGRVPSVTGSCGASGSSGSAGSTTSTTGSGSPAAAASTSSSSSPTGVAGRNALRAAGTRCTLFLTVALACFLGVYT